MRSGAHRRLAERSALFDDGWALRGRECGIKAVRAGTTIDYTQVTTGSVVNSKIVVEGSGLPEGAVVTVLSRGGAEGFSLSEVQENELLEAIAATQRGDFEMLDEFLATLRNQPKA